MTGFVGVLAGRSGLVAEGLGEGVLQRWDRWFELCAARGLPETLDPRRPAWRLVARPGLFGAEGLFGVLRLGRDARGRTYPCAVLRPGDPPDPCDPWFDAVERLVRRATEGEETLSTLLAAVAQLPVPAAGPSPAEGAALLWRDDWEVRVHHAATAADLVAFPLALAADAAPGEAAA